MTAAELAVAGAGESGGTATALAVPAGDSLAEDFEDGTPGDPAEQAETWRQDAAGIRAERDRVIAEAQAEIGRVQAEAAAEAARLDAEAEEADGHARKWQEAADLAAEIVRAEAEVITLTGARDALRAEDTRLAGESEQLTARLEDFAAARAEAGQRLRTAPDINDVDGSIAAVKDALATIAAIDEAARPSAQRRAAADMRLAVIRGEEGELAGVLDRLGRAHLRLIDLRRRESGLPPVGERQAITAALQARFAVLYAQDAEKTADTLLTLVPGEDGREQLRASLAALGETDRTGVTAAVAAGGALAVALGEVIGQFLDLIAVQAPAVYEGFRKVHLEGSAPAPEAEMSVREVLAQPGRTLLPDGTVRYETPYTGWGRSARTSAPLPPLPGREGGGAHGG